MSINNKSAGLLVLVAKEEQLSLKKRGAAPSPQVAHWNKKQK